MPGLVPGIHVLVHLIKKDVMAGTKPGHDGNLRCLSPPFEQRLEIGARALCLDPRGLRRFAEAEIAVDQAGAMIISGRDAGGGKRVGIGLALVAQRIEPRRANDGRRKPCKAFRAQRRNPPVRAVPPLLPLLAPAPLPPPPPHPLTLAPLPP